MNESHISSQRLNLDPCPIHSSEGIAKWFKDGYKFNDAWLKNIKPIIKHEPDNLIKYCINTDRVSFTKINKEKTVELMDFIQWLKPIYTYLRYNNHNGINFKNFDRMVYPKNPLNQSKPNDKIKLSTIEKELVKQLMKCNTDAMPEIKRKVFEYLKKIRKYETIKVTGTDEQILNHYIECNSENAYKNQLSKASDEGDHISYNVSISNWYNFEDEDDGGPINDWDSVWPLINIIYKTWYPRACNAIKKLGGTNVYDNNGGYISFDLKE